MASPIRGVRFQRPKKKPASAPSKPKTPKNQQVGTPRRAPTRGTGTTQSRTSGQGTGGVGTTTRKTMPSVPKTGQTGATTKKTTTTPSVTRSRQSTTGGVRGGTKPKTNTENTGSGQATGRGSAGMPKKPKKGPGMSTGKTVPTYNEVVRRKTGGRV